MSYKVLFATGAKKAFLNLPKQTIEILTLAIDDLQKNPRPPGAKKLSGIDGYRVRKGDYRILYAIDDKERVVAIYRVGHRRDVYRR